LRVRSKPEVSEESVKYEPLLWRGALAWVLEGPVRASGYDWYRIDPMGEADVQYHPDPPPAGWVVAASKDGEPWIADADSESCPSTPLGTVSDFDYPRQGMIGLSCFGNRTIEFVAAVTIQSERSCAETPEQIEPAWLRPCGNQYVADSEGGFAQGVRVPLYLTLAPEVVMHVSRKVENGKWIKVWVSGHYDDARARDCRISNRPGDERTVRLCRSQFVVTKLVS
jgi:hypothetical protein